MIGMGLIWPVTPKLIETISGRDISGASLLGGWLFFAYGAMQFLCGPAIGNLSDAYGRRPVLLLAVAGLGVDYLLTAFAPTMTWLFAGRIIAGICGASYVTANACLADVTAPEDRAKAFGLMGAAFGLGFVIGPAIGGIVGQWGPRVPFFVAAGLAIANFAFGYFALPETLALHNRRPFSLLRSNPAGSLKVFATYRGVLPTAFAMFVYFVAGAVYPAIWAFWAIARFGWNELTIGLTLAAFGLLTALSQGLLTGPIVKAFGEYRTMIFGLAIGAAVSIAYGFVPSLAWVLVLIVLHTPEGFVNPAMTAIMSHAAPADAQGEMQGGIASLQSLGMLIGTLFFSQVFGHFARPDAFVVSTGVAFYIAGAAMILALLLALIWIRPERPTPR